MVGSPKAVPSVYSDADERLTRLLRDAHPGRRPACPWTGAATAADRDPCYHLLCDTLANVDRRVLQRMAWATVAALQVIEDEP
jgi:hypothetical protein